MACSRNVCFLYSSDFYYSMLPSVVVAVQVGGLEAIMPWLLVSLCRVLPVCHGKHLLGRGV